MMNLKIWPKNLLVVTYVIWMLHICLGASEVLAVQSPTTHSESNTATGSRTNKPKVKPEVPPNRFYFLQAFIDFLGPFQHQAFAQSSVTGEQKYDPVLMSFGLKSGVTLSEEHFDHGPTVLGRTSRAFSNTITYARDGETDSLVRHINVSSFGFGFGYQVRRARSADNLWYPTLGLGIEQSIVKLMISDSGTSKAYDVRSPVKSTLIVGYLDVGSEWMFDRATPIFGLGFHCLVPTKTWRIDERSSTAESELLKKLDHKAAIGVGLIFAVGWII